MPRLQHPPHWHLPEVAFGVALCLRLISGAVDRGTPSVHLKTLTLRGFKSFASATTLRLEPGITCVVGPNGSGKSNVVDALAWVMGEQGAKSLRGGKMEDVIFAGTSGRPPLGRAEVALTIDNSDGALPIDYAEVTITRTMFRNGGSEYAINGDSCRLLDIQELLSDSGIGREMHVIVGQGQLDAILSATPEERRGFVEEAAGVLKHRKRKEKALRKLDAMQANLTRVSDLVTELRRQLKPLGKQAEVARRAAVVQADLRDARLRLLADDLIALRTNLEAEVADEAALRERQAQVEGQLAEVRERETELTVRLGEAAPALAAAQETWYRLSALRERLSGVGKLAGERVRLLAADPADNRPGRDPDQMQRDAEEIRAQEADLADGVEASRQVLTDAVNARKTLEEELATEERRVASGLRAAADRREGLARLQGKVNSLRAGAAAREAEIGRLTAAAAEAAARAERSEAEFAALESEATGLNEGELDLDEAHEAAAAVLAEAEETLAALQARDRETDRERTALRARKETLELSLARRDGAAVLLAAPDEHGVVGSVARLLTVQAGHETAVSAALAGVSDAVAVASLHSAVATLTHLKTSDAGQAHLVVTDAPTAEGTDRTPPPGATPLLELVSVPTSLRATVHALLADWLLVPDLATAADVVGAHSWARTVTPDGDVLTAHRAAGGSASPPSLLAIQSAVDEATAALTRAEALAETLHADLARAEAARSAAARAAADALEKLNESDAGLAALGEQLGRLGAAARGARAETERLTAAVTAAELARDADLGGLAELEERLEQAERDPVETDIGTDERDRLAAACTAGRGTELEARLAVRTGEERVAGLAGRADALLRAAAAERAARERAAARQIERERAGRLAAAVTIATAHTLGLLEASLATAATERAAAEDARRGLETGLAELRGAERELDGELSRLTDSVHRDEVARAEHRLRIEALEQRALEELGIAPDVLIAEYGPDQLVPVLAEITDVEGGVVAVAEEPEKLVPFIRADQEKRLRAAERALALLGKVNPLALEEFAALEERSSFLTTQLEDLRKSQRDLLTVIAEVDARVQEVFTAAWLDVQREFEGVFSRLFPGGEGRLLLTNPDDMLTTGIDVEARPPGKKVKRLSLLSGGERSLVAVAMLVSIFRARPSPFYVLDEVEAALDDTNLGRLIGIMEELRDSSQLIVITHQKRTMEVADALYGVSMRGDGVTTVISQKLREEQPA
jgi:chromosome segregation protein